MVVAEIDLIDRKLTFASAGHPGPIIGSGPGGELVTLDGSGLPLGIRPGTTYSTQTRPWAEGGFFFLYSDGLSESRGSDGNMLGCGGMTRLADNARREKRPLTEIMTQVGAHATKSLQDDMTAVWVSFIAASAGW